MVREGLMWTAGITASDGRGGEGSACVKSESQVQRERVAAQVKAEISCGKTCCMLLVAEGGRRRRKSGALAAQAIVCGSLLRDPAFPASPVHVCCQFTALMFSLLFTLLGAV